MVLLSRVLTGAMLMGGISTKPHTCWCVGLGALLGPGATGHHNKKTPRVGVVWCGCFSSVPYLIQHVTVFGGVVGGCGVVVWLLHSGREHLVRMTPLCGVLFSCM